MERETTTDNEIQDADQFWDTIEHLLATQCPDHDSIDQVLRSYLALLGANYDRYITTEDHLGHCAYLLYASSLFAHSAAYIRQQLIYCLLQEDDTNVLRIAVVFLLADARENDATFDLLNKEGTLPRLVELIAHPRQHEETMHRTLMELLYEMSRIQKLANDDLAYINDDFVCGLFDIIEQVSDDANDPYHYPVIRVLLVLNEQFMVAAHDPAVLSNQSMPLTNKVVKVLSAYGSRYKTFGANIILLLNREDETSLQLLTLKLMYLLFTTPLTYEYFYTNDLRVLVDILVRNLLDLPEYAAALRHTYLRVLYPLLEHTQLQYPPYYKRDEIQKLLALLCGERVENEDGAATFGHGWNHFEDVDETTKRLVKRCQTVSWLSVPETSELIRVESPDSEQSHEPESPISPSKSHPPQLPTPRKLRKRDSSKTSNLTIGGFLTPRLEGARQSSISMAEMAQQKEKPGVITPSRHPSVKHGLIQTMFTKKEKPPPPKARRSGFMRPKPQTTSSSVEMMREARVIPETPLEEKDSASIFEDAVEEQKEGALTQHHTMISEGQSSTPGNYEENAMSPVMKEGSQSPEASPRFATKKPPPAPKARRGWRMRKSKDLADDQDKEPGKFSSRMPSVNIQVTQSLSSPSTQTVSEGSPFSPVKDKTLDHLESARSSFSPGAGESKRSVSDAMNQAQVQAVQQVAETLDNTHIAAQPDDEKEQKLLSEQQSPRSTGLQNQHSHRIESESPPLQRTVLAPPGQAPIRPVPGPQIDLEKSPFLSDDEKEEIPAQATEKILKTKESWEDFDNDDD